MRVAAAVAAAASVKDQDACKIHRKSDDRYADGHEMQHFFLGQIPRQVQGGRTDPGGKYLVNAPYIQEFSLILECKFVHTFELGLHTQFDWEIMDVKVDESVLDAPIFYVLY